MPLYRSALRLQCAEAQVFSLVLIFELSITGDYRCSWLYEMHHRLQLAQNQGSGPIGISRVTQCHLPC